MNKHITDHIIDNIKPYSIAVQQGKFSVYQLKRVFLKHHMKDSIICYKKTKDALPKGTDFSDTFSKHLIYIKPF